MNFSGKLRKVLSPLLAFFAFALVGTVVFFLKNSGTQFSTMNKLENISFNTNGKITEKWVIDALGIKNGIDLFALDIAAMKKYLESIPQIKRVFIEKRYPNSLLIKIDERLPILKIAVKMDGKKQLFLIDELEGTVFPPLCYTRDDISKILAANLELKLDGVEKATFCPIPGVGAVKNLVDTLKNNFRDIFDLVRVIDLRNYDSRPGAVWSNMELLLNNGMIVVLAPKNFEAQLLRLDYLMNEKCKDDLHRIGSINISSPNDVVIGYK
jgi:cell division septal protein FtsQ